MQLVVGGLSRHQLRETLAVREVELNTYAEQLLAHSCFEGGTGRPLVVGQRSVGGLGLPDGGSLSEVLAAVQRQDLGLCPPETGPYLRLAMEDQEQASDSVLSAGRAPTGALTIASTPLTEDDEYPKGFYLRVVDGTSWLRGYRCDDDYLWSPHDRFVVRVPRPCDALEAE